MSPIKSPVSVVFHKHAMPRLHACGTGRRDMSSDCISLSLEHCWGGFQPHAVPPTHLTTSDKVTCRQISLQRLHLACTWPAGMYVSAAGPARSQRPASTPRRRSGHPSPDMHPSSASEEEAQEAYEEDPEVTWRARLAAEAELDGGGAVPPFGAGEYCTVYCSSLNKLSHDSLWWLWHPPGSGRNGSAWSALTNQRRDTACICVRLSRAGVHVQSTCNPGPCGGGSFLSNGICGNPYRCNCLRTLQPAGAIPTGPRMQKCTMTAQRCHGAARQSRRTPLRPASGRRWSGGVTPASTQPQREFMCQSELQLHACLPRSAAASRPGLR